MPVIFGLHGGMATMVNFVVGSPIGDQVCIHIISNEVELVAVYRLFEGGSSLLLLDPRQNYIIALVSLAYALLLDYLIDNGLLLVFLTRGVMLDVAAFHPICSRSHIIALSLIFEQDLPQARHIFRV